MANSARFLPYGVHRIVIVLLLALLGTPCFAGTFTAFGPQVYVRSTGDPVTVTNSFTVLNPNTQYTLRLHNGGLVDSSTDRVSSTTVTVNGVIVVAPNDLNQNVAEVDKPVTLLATNQIDVQVRGAPGGTLAIDIIGVDNDLPVLVASANPGRNANDWNNSNVVITFACADATSGIASCTSPVTVSTEGTDQVVSGQAIDRAGNVASTTVKVSIDKGVPGITFITSPAPNAAGWNNADVTITYQCSDALSGVATCPDPALVSTEGAAQRIVGTATDRADNASSQTTLISLDKTPPMVSISSPAQGAIVNTSTVNISGAVSDALSGLAKVTCNGVAATVTGSSFTCTQSLAAGTNAISVQAVDVAGNSASAATTIAYVKPPQITITSPVSSALFNQSPINVTGTVVDPAAHVLVNGLTAPVSGNSFLATVPAQEGISTITAVVTNSDGSTDTASVQIDLDTTPPHVAIYAPLDGSVTPDGSVTVTGLVNDIVVGTVNPQQATVKVNGVAAQVANRSFSVSNIPLVVGPNLIHATAVDAAGNQATTTVTVVRQAPGQPAVRVFSGNNQSGTIGTQLAQPLVAQVVNATGQPVANVPVVFRVTSQDGKLGPANPGLSDIAVNTDVQGQASVQFTLGSHAGAGNNLVEASTTGVPATAVFSSSAVSSGATLINVDSGNNQFGVVGQSLPLPFIAVVTDAGHNRIPGVPVTFTVKQGAGNVNGQPSVTLNTDGDGRVQAILTLGPDAGINNNLLEATFPGNTAFPAAFTATGRTQGPAAATAISGVVLDNSNQPIPGVTMRLFQLNQGPSGNLPQQVGTPVVTDGEGQFTIQPAPVGVFKLMADGGTATRPGVWPTLEYDIITTPGQNNTVGSPIYLPQLNPDNKLCVTPSTGGTLTVPQVPGFSLTIAPGSATFPGGSHTGCVTVTPVNMDKVPMVPGFGQQPRFVVTIQPVGTMFNPPAAMTIPNVDGLAPRAVTEMYSYDHDLASFVAIGTATVSDDGSVIKSDPGVGVLKAGWHCGGDPNTTGSAGTCPTCQKCSGSNCVADTSQDGAPIPDNKCKVCKNGVPTLIDDSGTEVTLSETFGLPSDTVDKFNDFLEKFTAIGVLAKANLLEITGSVKTKECCVPTTGDKGHNTTGSVTGNFGGFSLEGKIWPPGPIPSIDIIISVIGLASVEAKAQFIGGVFLGGNVKVVGEVGRRKNECSEDPADRAGCFFARLDIPLTLTATAKIGGTASLSFDCIFCIKETIEAEGTLIIGGFSWPINISSVSYNVPACSSGLSGGLLQPQDGEFKVGVEFKGKYTPEGGVSQSINFSADFLSCKINLSGVTCE
jgi:hypothetical protein